MSTLDIILRVLRDFKAKNPSVTYRLYERQNEGEKPFVELEIRDEHTENR